VPIALQELAQVVERFGVADLLDAEHVARSPITRASSVSFAS